MPVKPPTIDELRRISQDYYLNPSTADLESFLGLLTPMLDSYARLDQLTEPSLPVGRPRTSGYRPAPEDNPLGAWYWRCDLQGDSGGVLSGKTVAIKDNVCVAGIPMMNGTSVLEGYTPGIDATIVTRILEAGGNIPGKAVCESLCFSGGSHTSDTGPVRNPVNVLRSAGGSSSGSAALVAAGEVDMAIGGDQGGSIRIPASWCGVVGLKPTYGLVPYTGVFPIELTLDHTGPIARSTSDVALLLEAVAGPDGLDPRQSAGLHGQAYSQALTGDVRGLRLGILQEGFGHEDLSERDVDKAVTNAARSFEGLGAHVETVSIPWHLHGQHIWSAIAVEGATMLMVAGNSMGTNWKGHYYAKAQNLARTLKAAYDEALSRFDLLVMPTLPMKATEIPAPDCSREEYTDRALEMIPNTCPFDVTGHPAITIPCGVSEGLPIGMMLVGRTGDDATVLRAADAYERNASA